MCIFSNSAIGPAYSKNAKCAPYRLNAIESYITENQRGGFDE